MSYFLLTESKSTHAGESLVHSIIVSSFSTPKYIRWVHGNQAKQVNKMIAAISTWLTVQPINFAFFKKVYFSSLHLHKSRVDGFENTKKIPGPHYVGEPEIKCKFQNDAFKTDADITLNTGTTERQRGDTAQVVVETCIL